MSGLTAARGEGGSLRGKGEAEAWKRKERASESKAAAAAASGEEGGGWMEMSPLEKRGPEWRSTARDGEEGARRKRRDGKHWESARIPSLQALKSRSERKK